MSVRGLTIHTQRLILRQWQAADFEPLAAFLADDDANRYRGPGRGISRDEAWAAALELAGQWPLRGYGTFAVEEKSTGRLVGWAGLWHPQMIDEPELAWSLFPEAQGKGYASEAGAAVIDWAADALGLPPLFSFVHPSNTPSRRLAERLGAKQERETEFRGEPRIVYRHRRGGAGTTHQSDQNRSLSKCLS